MSTSTVIAVPTSPPLSKSPRPLQLIDSNVPPLMDSPTSLSSPRASLSHGLSTPPPTARTFRPGNARRQSSISYFPSDHLSSNCRSPTSPFYKLPRRSNSVGIWDDGGATRSRGDRRSLGQLGTGKEPLSPGLSAAHGPLTLTEKHADLLQFIAQKEAKCLELRSQLAAHEAELAQLKRKWEKIVSRGMDRAYSSQGASSTSPPASTVSSIIPTASAAIKEGARLLAAGLDLSAQDTASQHTPVLASPMVPVSGFAAVSRAALASSPAVRKATARHGATQSMSSVSTASSSTRGSTAQSSQRLSQSSDSSLTSALSLEDPVEDDSCVERQAKTSTVVAQPRQGLRRRSQEGAQARSPLASSPVTTDQPKVSGATTTPKAKARPASLAFTNMPATSAHSPVPSWMGSVGTSVGRKWEELQKGETFTKSQKRASLLLSDVSQSLFAVLTPPASSGIPSPLVKPSPLSSIAASSSTSLLDDEPEQLGSDTSPFGAVLVPSRVMAAPTLSHEQTRKTDFDDEDWNW